MHPGIAEHIGNAGVVCYFQKSNFNKMCPSNQYQLPSSNYMFLMLIHFTLQRTALQKPNPNLINL